MKLNPRFVFLLPVILLFSVASCGDGERLQGPESVREDSGLSPVLEDSNDMNPEKQSLRIALFGGSFCIKKGFSSLVHDSLDSVCVFLYFLILSLTFLSNLTC